MNVLVQNVLPRYLSAYCESDSLKSLSASWTGDTIQGSNIVLKQSVLDAAQLSSFRLCHGSIGLLRISIPGGVLGIRRLLSEAVRIEVRDVHVLLERQGLPSLADAQAAQEAARLRDLLTDTELYRQRLLEVLEPLVSATIGAVAGAGAAAATGSGGVAGFLDDLKQAIVRNGQLELSGVHVRYEDSSTCPDLPFAVGLTLGQFTTAAATAGASADDGQATAVVPAQAGGAQGTAAMSAALSPSQSLPAVDGLQFRTAVLDRLAAYWDPLADRSNSRSSAAGSDGSEDTGLFTSLVAADPSVRRAGLEAGIAVLGRAPRHHYLLAPCSPSMQLAINPDLRVPGQPLVRAILGLDDVQLGLTRDQFAAGTLLSDFLAEHARRQELARLRPALPPRDKHSVMLWWKYVMVRLKGGAKALASSARWDPNRIPGSLTKRRPAYITAYRKLLEADGQAMKKALETSLKAGASAAPPAADALKGSVDKATNETLTKLEAELTYEQVIEFRAVARAMYEEVVEAETTKAQQKAAAGATAKANKGWLGWMWSDDTPPEPAPDAGAAASAAGQASPAKAPSTPHSTARDRARELAERSRKAVSDKPMYNATARLNRASFSLFLVPGHPIAVAALAGRAAYQSTTGRNSSAAVVITDLSVADGVTRKSAWPFILSRREHQCAGPGTTAAAGGLVTDGTTAQGQDSPGLLTFDLETHPKDNPDLDYRVRLVSEPLQVVAAMEPLRALSAFVDVPNGSQVAQEAAEAAASVQAAIVSDTYSVLASATRLDLVARIAAPWVVLPSDVTNDRSARLTLRLGDLMLASSDAESEIASREAQLASDPSVSPEELSAAKQRLRSSLLTARDYQTWRLQVSEVGAFLHWQSAAGANLTATHGEHVIDPIALDVAVQTCIQPAARVKNRLRVYGVLPRLAASVSVAFVRHMALLQAQYLQLAKDMAADAAATAREREKRQSTRAIGAASGGALSLVPAASPSAPKSASKQATTTPAKGGTSHSTAAKATPSSTHKSATPHSSQRPKHAAPSPAAGSRSPGGAASSSSSEPEPSGEAAESLVLDFSMHTVQLRFCDVRRAASRMVTLIRSGSATDLSHEPPLGGSGALAASTAGAGSGAAAAKPDLTVSLSGIHFRGNLGITVSTAHFGLASLEIEDGYQRAGPAFAYLISSTRAPDASKLPASARALLAPQQGVASGSKHLSSVPLINIDAVLRTPADGVGAHGTPAGRATAHAEPRIEIAAAFSSLHIGYNPETVAALQLYGAYLGALLAPPPAAEDKHGAGSAGHATAPGHVAPPPLPPSPAPPSSANGKGRASTPGEPAGRGLVDALTAALSFENDDSDDELFFDADPAFSFSEPSDGKGQGKAGTQGSGGKADGPAGGKTPGKTTAAAAATATTTGPQMKVVAKLAGLSLCLNKERQHRRVAIAFVSSVAVEYQDLGSDGGTKTSVTLQELALIDPATENTKYPELIARDTASASAASSSPLLQLSFSGLPSGHPSGLDSLVEATLASPRLVYVARAWDEVIDYLLTGLLGTALASASQLAGQAITEAASSRLGLRVALTQATVLLPVHSRSHRALSLGISHIGLDNAFVQDDRKALVSSLSAMFPAAPVSTLVVEHPIDIDQTVDKMTIRLDGLQLSTVGKGVSGRLQHTSMTALEAGSSAGLQLSLTITRPFTTEYAAHVPGLRLGLAAHSLKLNCSRDQYALILDALALNIGGPADPIKPVVPALTDGAAVDPEESVSVIAYADTAATAANTNSAPAAGPASVPSTPMGDTPAESPVTPSTPTAVTPSSSSSFLMPGMIVDIDVPRDIALTLSGHERLHGLAPGKGDVPLLTFALQRFGLQYVSIPSADSLLLLRIGQLVAVDVRGGGRDALVSASSSTSASQAAARNQLQLRLGMSSTSDVGTDLSITLSSTRVQVLPEPIERLLWFVGAPTMQVPAAAAQTAAPAGESDAGSTTAAAPAVKQRTQIVFKAEGTHFLLPCGSSGRAVGPTAAGAGAVVATSGTPQQAAQALQLSFSGSVRYGAVSDGSEMSVGAELTGLQVTNGSGGHVLSPTDINADVKQTQQEQRDDSNTVVRSNVQRDVSVTAGKLQVAISHGAVLSGLSFFSRLQGSGLLDTKAEEQPAEDASGLLIMLADTVLTKAVQGAAPPAVPTPAQPAQGAAAAPATVPTVANDAFNLSWAGLDVSLMDDVPNREGMASPVPAGTTSSPLVRLAMQAVSIRGSGLDGLYTAQAGLELVAHLGGRRQAGHAIVVHPWKFTADVSQTQGVATASTGAAAAKASSAVCTDVRVAATNSLAVQLHDTDLSSILTGLGQWSKAMAAATASLGATNVSAATTTAAVVPAAAPALADLSSIKSVHVVPNLRLAVQLPLVRADLYFSSGGGAAAAVPLAGALSLTSSLPGPDAHGRHLVRLYAADLGFSMHSSSIDAVPSSGDITALQNLGSTSSMDIRMAGLHILDVSNAGVHGGAFGVLVTSFEDREKLAALRGLCSQLAGAKNDRAEASEEFIHASGAGSLVHVKLQSVSPALGRMFSDLDGFKSGLGLAQVDSTTNVAVDSLSVGWNAASVRKLLVWLQAATGTADEEVTVSTTAQNAGAAATAAAAPAAVVDPSSSTLSVSVRSLSFGLYKDLAARKVAVARVQGTTVSMDSPRTGPSKLNVTLASLQLNDMTQTRPQDFEASGSPIIAARSLIEGAGSHVHGPILRLDMESGCEVTADNSGVGSKLHLVLAPVHVVYSKPVIDEALAYLNSDILPVLLGYGAQVDEATGHGDVLVGPWPGAREVTIRKDFMAMDIQVGESLVEVPGSISSGSMGPSLQATVAAVRVTSTLVDAPVPLHVGSGGSTSLVRPGAPKTAAGSVMRIELDGLHLLATQRSSSGKSAALPLLSKPVTMHLTLTSHRDAQLALATGTAIHIPLPGMALNVDAERLRTVHAVLDRNILADMPEAATPKATCVRSDAYIPHPGTNFDPQAKRCGRPACSRAFPVVAVREWCAACGRTVCVACVGGQVWDEEGAAAKTVCVSCLRRMERQSDASEMSMATVSSVSTPAGELGTGHEDGRMGAGAAPQASAQFQLLVELPLLQLGLCGPAAAAADASAPPKPFVLVEVIGGRYSLCSGDEPILGDKHEAPARSSSMAGAWDSRQSFEVMALQVRQTASLPSTGGTGNSRYARLPVGGMSTIVGPNLASLMPHGQPGPSADQGLSAAVADSSATPALFVSISSRYSDGTMKLRAGLFNTDVHPHLPVIYEALKVLGAYSEELGPDGADDGDVAGTGGQQQGQGTEITARPAIAAGQASALADHATTHRAPKRMRHLGPVTVRSAKPASILDLSASLVNLRLVVPRSAHIPMSKALVLSVPIATVTGLSQDMAVRHAVLAGIRQGLLEGHTAPVPANPESAVGAYSPGLLARGRVQDSTTQYTLERAEIGLSLMQLADAGLVEDTDEEVQATAPTAVLINTYEPLLPSLGDTFKGLAGISAAEVIAIHGGQVDSLASAMNVPSTSLLTHNVALAASYYTSETRVVGADLSSVVDPTGRLLLSRPGWRGSGGRGSSSFPKIDPTSVLAISRPPPAQTNLSLSLDTGLSVRASPADVLAAQGVLDGFLAGGNDGAASGAAGNGSSQASQGNKIGPSASAQPGASHPSTATVGHGVDDTLLDVPDLGSDDGDDDDFLSEFFSSDGNAMVSKYGGQQVTLSEEDLFEPRGLASEHASHTKGGPGHGTSSDGTSGQFLAWHPLDYEVLFPAGVLDNAAGGSKVKSDRAPLPLGIGIEGRTLAATSASEGSASAGVRLLVVTDVKEKTQQQAKPGAALAADLRRLRARNTNDDPSSAIPSLLFDIGDGEIKSRDRSPASFAGAGYLQANDVILAANGINMCNSSVKEAVEQLKMLRGVKAMRLRRLPLQLKVTAIEGIQFTLLRATAPTQGRMAGGGKDGEGVAVSARIDRIQLDVSGGSDDPASPAAVSIAPTVDIDLGRLRRTLAADPTTAEALAAATPQRSDLHGEDASGRLLAPLSLRSTAALWRLHTAAVRDAHKRPAGACALVSAELTVALDYYNISSGCLEPILEPWRVAADVAMLDCYSADEDKAHRMAGGHAKKKAGGRPVQHIAISAGSAELVASPALLAAVKRTSAEWTEASLAASAEALDYGGSNDKMTSEPGESTPRSVHSALSPRPGRVGLPRTPSAFAVGGASGGAAVRALAPGLPPRAFPIILRNETGANVAVAVHVPGTTSHASGVSGPRYGAVEYQGRLDQAAASAATPSIVSPHVRWEAHCNPPTVNAARAAFKSAADDAHAVILPPSHAVGVSIDGLDQGEAGSNGQGSQATAGTIVVDLTQLLMLVDPGVSPSAPPQKTPSWCAAALQLRSTRPGVVSVSSPAAVVDAATGSRVPVQLYLQTRILDGRTVVTLRSMAIIHNHTGLDLKLYSLDNSSGARSAVSSRQLMGVVPRRSSFPVPLSCCSAAAVAFEPVVADTGSGVGFVPSAPVIITKPGVGEVACRPSGASGDATSAPIYLTVRSKYVRDVSNMPAYLSLTLSPPLVLTNALPLRLAYRVSSRVGATQAMLLPGERVELHEVSMAGGASDGREMMSATPKDSGYGPEISFRISSAGAAGAGSADDSAGRWSNGVNIGLAPSEQRVLRESTITSADRSSAPLKIQLEIASKGRRVTDDAGDTTALGWPGAVQVVAFAPYWVVNATGLPLAVGQPGTEGLGGDSTAIQPCGVQGSRVPIVEEVWENERHYGLTNWLDPLPHERNRWTTETGVKKDHPTDLDIKGPPPGWEWVGSWHVGAWDYETMGYHKYSNRTTGGQPNLEYRPGHIVRRRRWTRVRSYVADSKARASGAPKEPAGVLPGYRLETVSLAPEGRTFRMIPATAPQSGQAGNAPVSNPTDALSCAELGSPVIVPGSCVIPCSPQDGAVHLTIPGGRWSDLIPVQQGSSAKEAQQVVLLQGKLENGPMLTLPGQRSSGSGGETVTHYELIVVRSRCPPPFSNTYVLHVYPRYTVVNASHEPLAVRQAGLPERAPLVPGSSPACHPEVQLPPFSAAPWWWSTKPEGDGSKRVQLSPAIPSPPSTTGVISPLLAQNRGGWSAPVPVLAPSSGVVMNAPVAVVCPPLKTQQGKVLPTFLRSDMGLTPVGTSVLSVSLRPHPTVPLGSLLVVGRATHPDLPVRTPDDALPPSKAGPAELLALGTAAAADMAFVHSRGSGAGSSTVGSGSALGGGAVVSAPRPVVARPPLAVINHSDCTLCVMQEGANCYWPNGNIMDNHDINNSGNDLTHYRKLGAQADSKVFPELGLPAARAVTYVPPGAVIPIGLSDPVPALTGQPVKLFVRAISVYASAVRRPAGASPAGAAEAGPPASIDLAKLEIPMRLKAAVSPALAGRSVSVVVRMGPGGAREVVVSNAHHASDAGEATEALRAGTKRDSVESWSAALERAISHGSSNSTSALSAILDTAPREASGLADALEFGPGRGPIDLYMEALYRLYGLGADKDGSHGSTTSVSVPTFPVRTWDGVWSLELAGVGLSLVGAGPEAAESRPGLTSASPSELLYATLRGLSVSVSTSPGSMSARVSLNRLQFDDQDLGNPAPAVLAVAGSPAVSLTTELTSNHSAATAPGGILGVLMDPATALTGAHVKRLDVALQPLRLRLTFELLCRLLRLQKAVADSDSGSSTLAGASTTTSAAAASEGALRQLADPDLPMTILLADVESHADNGSQALSTLLKGTALALAQEGTDAAADTAAGTSNRSADVASRLLGGSSAGLSLTGAQFFADHAVLHTARLAIDYGRVRADESDDEVFRSVISSVLGESPGGGSGDVGAELPPFLTAIIGAGTRATADLLTRIVSNLTLSDAVITAGGNNGLASVTNGVTTLGALLSAAADQASSDLMAQKTTLLASTLAPLSSGTKALDAVKRGDVAGVAQGAVGVVGGVVSTTLGTISHVSGLVSKTAAKVAGDPSAAPGGVMPSDPLSISGMRPGALGAPKGQLAGVAVGVATGAATTVAGVVGGVTGLFTETAKGMQKAAESASKGDAKGFFGNIGMGLGKGVVGVVARPLAGLAGGASLALQGAVSTVTAIQSNVDSTVASVADAVSNLPGTPVKTKTSGGGFGAGGEAGGVPSSPATGRAGAGSSIDAPVDRVRQPRPLYGPRGAVRPFDAREAAAVARLRSRALKAAVAASAPSGGGLADALLMPVLSEHVWSVADLPDIAPDGSPNPYASVIVTTGRLVAMDNEGRPAAVVPLTDIEAASPLPGREAVIVKINRPGVGGAPSRRGALTLPIDLNLDDHVAAAEGLARAIDEAGRAARGGAQGHGAHRAE